MYFPRGYSAGPRPVSGSVLRRRIVLHRPLPASERSRLWLLRHGNNIRQLHPKMWASMYPTYYNILSFLIDHIVFVRGICLIKYILLELIQHAPSNCLPFCMLYSPFYVCIILKHQVYTTSTDPHVCCGSCKNVSCTFTNENGTTELSAVRTNTSMHQCSTFWAVLSLIVCAGREFLGGELHPLRLHGDSSGSRDTGLWGGLPAFQWHIVSSGQDL